MDQLQLDTTSFVLIAIIVSLLGLGIYLRPPPPNAHPFLLGRQSTTSNTRYTSESPIYTNSTTGGIRAPLRPDKRVRTLKDILDESNTCLEGGEKGTWIKGGEKLKTVVYQLRAGLLSTLGTSAKSGPVAVLVEDPTDALLIILALALTPHTPLVISPGSNIPSTAPITAIIQSSTLFSVAESLSTTPDAKWISLGDDSTQAQDLLVTGKKILEEGEGVEVKEAQPSDVALTIVSEGISLPLTHLNLTASLVTWLGLFPASPRPTRPTLKDSLFTFHHPSTPYGLGLALFTIYTSSSLQFHTLPPSASHEDLSLILKNKASPSPSLIFAPSSLLSQPLYAMMLDQMRGDSAFFIKQSRDGKLRLMRQGVLTTTSFWDKLLWNGLRKETALYKVRALVLEGPIAQNRTELFRMALGNPVMSTLGHAFLLAPMTAAMMWDLQRLPELKTTKEGLGHVGPPAVGVDIKIRGEESEIATGRIRGEILIRTPLLPAPTHLPPSLLNKDSALPSLPNYPGTAGEDGAKAMWLRTGVRGQMGTEGVVWLEQ